MIEKIENIILVSGVFLFVVGMVDDHFFGSTLDSTSYQTHPFITTGNALTMGTVIFRFFRLGLQGK